MDSRTRVRITLSTCPVFTLKANLDFESDDDDDEDDYDPFLGLYHNSCTPFLNHCPYVLKTNVHSLLQHFNDCAL